MTHTVPRARQGDGAAVEARDSDRDRGPSRVDGGVSTAGPAGGTANTSRERIRTIVVDDHDDIARLVADRIEDVARVVGDPRRVMAGTDCGFDTSAGMGRVTEDVVWAKMKAMAEGAKIASERLGLS